MERTKSAIKRAKQAEKRHARLKPYKTHMKTMVRNVLEAVKAGKKDEALKDLPMAQKALDKAVKKGILHRNTAARRKSLMSRAIASVK